MVRRCVPLPGTPVQLSGQLPLVSTRQVARAPSVSRKVALAGKNEALYFSLDSAKSILPTGEFAVRPRSALSGESPLPAGAVLCINSVRSSNQEGFSRDQRFGRCKICLAEWAGQCAGPDEDCPLGLIRHLAKDSSQFLWGFHASAEWSPLQSVPPTATGSSVPAADAAALETAPCNATAGSSRAEAAGTQ